MASCAMSSASWWSPRRRSAWRYARGQWSRTSRSGVVAAAEGRIAVLDTRKSTPLHRALEKAAVRHGGGENHRMGLYDMVLIKENHLRAAGGVARAVGLDGSVEALARRLEVLATEVGATEAVIVPADIPALAAEAATQWTGTFNPRPLTAVDALEVYRCAF